MSIQDKVAYIKQIINLVCEVVPTLIGLVKQIVELIVKIQES